MRIYESVPTEYYKFPALHIKGICKDSCMKVISIAADSSMFSSIFEKNMKMRSSESCDNNCLWFY